MVVLQMLTNCEPYKQLFANGILLSHFCLGGRKEPHLHGLQDRSNTHELYPQLVSNQGQKYSFWNNANVGRERFKLFLYITSEVL